MAGKNAGKSAAQKQKPKNEFIQVTLVDDEPTLRFAPRGEIGLSTTAIEGNFFTKEPKKAKKGMKVWFFLEKREGVWAYGRMFKGMDEEKSPAQKSGFNLYTWLNETFNRKGWFYASTPAIAAKQKQQKTEEKAKQLSKGAGFRSPAKATRERALEEMQFPLDYFLPADSIGLGYTLLFNFISGNPYVQDKFVKRESATGRGIISKDIEINGELSNVLGKIGPQRLQTKIVSYQEQALSKKGYVHLPLNTVMKSTTEISYGGKAMGLFEDLLTSYIRGGGKGVKDNIIAELGFKAATDTNIGQYQAAGNRFFGTDVNLAARFSAEEFQAGTSTNPRTYEQYTGSAPRSFEYKQTFHPESIEQAKNILLAVNKLKYHSQARRGETSPVRLMNPDRVIVRLIWGKLDTIKKDDKGYSNINDSYLFGLKPCVITKVDVSYGSAEEIGTYFDEGVPAEISIALSLKEQEITYADDIINEKIVRERISEEPKGTEK